MIKVIRKGFSNSKSLHDFIAIKRNFELAGNCCGDGYCRRYAD